MSIINNGYLNRKGAEDLFSLFHASVMLCWILFIDDWLIVFTIGKLLTIYLRKTDPQNDAWHLAPSAEMLRPYLNHLVTLFIVPRVHVWLLIMLTQAS